MSSIFHQSIARCLDTYHTGLINSRDVVELQSRLTCENASHSLGLIVYSRKIPLI